MVKCVDVDNGEVIFKEVTDYDIDNDDELHYFLYGIDMNNKNACCELSEFDEVETDEGIVRVDTFVSMIRNK